MPMTAAPNTKILAIFASASAAQKVGQEMRRAGTPVFMVRAADSAAQGFAGMAGKQAALYLIA